MGLSKVYRVLLLALLPVIALLIYMEGQHYDPALIQFQSSESKRDSMALFFPGEIAGFNRAGQIRLFTKENLYEYVNGHAEYFISAGFIGLAVGEYGKAGYEETDPEVVIDVYDMGKSIQAFGVLSDESDGNLSEIRTGLTGFRTPQGISFVKGRYYIRISTFNEKIPLESLTERIESTIDTESEPFPEVARLPELGKVVSTRFIKEAYRGLDFINNVIEREYEVNGETVAVFVVTGGEEKIRKLVSSFIDFFRQSDIQYSVIEEKGRGVYRINDPYEGDWVLVSFPDALFGIYGSFDDTIINTLLIESLN
jgi:hypothetical protein